ncbi:GHKL domain-containing protein [Bulleidia sp. HCP3S3_F2]|uniref:GHKL domain-containing protein n=1 Tax=unclassified Bulleidia TaxID=2704656 RepID=UPI003F89AEA6
MNQGYLSYFYILIATIVLIISGKKWKESIFLAMILNLMFYFIHNLCIILLSMHFYWGIQCGFLLKEHLVLIAVLEMVLFILSVILTSCLVKKKVIEIDGAVCFFVTSISIVLWVLSNYVHFLKFADYDLFSLCISGVVLVMGIVLEVYEQKKMRELVDEKDLALKYQSEKEALLKESYEELRTLKHDLKHVLTSQIDPDAISASLDQAFVPIETGYSYLDTIVNANYIRAIRLNIKFDTYIERIEKININENDLTLLLTNILDNAIRHTEGKKEILFEIYKKNGFLMIVCTNSMQHQILDKSGNIKINHSSKNGYGVKSINKIVKKYDGSIKYSQSEDTLTCSIAIYNG